jgi:hypothetical protein
MNIDIVSFARNGTKDELRWLVGQQFPLWIQECLRRKAAGEDCGKIIDELATVCNVTMKTEVLE